MQLQSLLHGTPPLRKLPWVVVYERFVAEINTSHRMRKEEAVITLLHGEDLFRIG
jgi:hypothetical protein